MDNAWIWIVVIVVVLAALAAAWVMTTRQREERQVQRAQGIRDDAAEQARLLEQRESKAAELEANSRAAQAEADARAAEAQRLAATAEHEQGELAEQRAELDGELQRADELDPTVDTTMVDGDAVPEERR